MSRSSFLNITAWVLAWATPFLCLGQTMSTVSEGERKMIERSQTSRVREITSRLTAEDFAGRGAAQPGGERAAQYIAEQFEKSGLLPLGDKGSYLQKVDLRGYRVLPTSSVTLEGMSLDKDKDYLFIPFQMSRSRLESRVDARGKVLFLPLGLYSDISRRRDLKRFQLKNKIVLLFTGTPQVAQLQQWAGVDLAPMVETLAREKVAGIIVVGPESWPRTVQDYASRRGVALFDAWPGHVSHMPPVVSITTKVARKFLAASGVDFDRVNKKVSEGHSVPAAICQSASISLRLQFESHPAPSYNVVGYLRGRGPDLNSEAILYSAHHDAYGIEPDGRFFPGAGDDALNVAGMVAIAEAMARGSARPLRSIVFLAAAGEESWKLGSFYWVNHATWPLNKIIANINLDGVGSETWGPVKVFYSIGSQQSNLSETVEDACRALELGFEPDTLAATRLLQRSDAFEFAKRGIPFVYGIGLPGSMSDVGAKFGPWMRDVTHYEQDKIQPVWNWDGVSTYNRLVMLIGLRIANTHVKPSWAEGSPFRNAVGEMGTNAR